MNETKPWWTSRGVIGGVVTVAILILGALFGIEIDENTKAIIIDQLVAAIGGILAIISSVVGIIGRVKAQKAIGPKPPTA